jgi:hypothetical protein
MVLGPVVLAVTMALIDMWRQRAEPKATTVPSSANGVIIQHTV